MARQIIPSSKTVQTQQGSMDIDNNRRTNSHWYDVTRDCFGTWQNIKDAGYKQVYVVLEYTTSGLIAAGEHVVLDYVMKLTPTDGTTSDDVRWTRMVLKSDGPDGTKVHKFAFLFKDLPTDERLVQSYMIRRAGNAPLGGDFGSVVSKVQLHRPAVHLEFS
jgi:hypothetical protein